MKRFLRYALYGFIGLVVLAGVGTAVFWRKIHETWAVYQYAQMFKGPEIFENFRNVYNRYPSVRIPREGEVSPLPKEERPLPETFVYKGEIRKVSDWLQRGGTTGFIVLKDGVIVHEEYDHGNSETSPAIAFSVSKSVVSFLVGNAVRDGLIDISQPVDHYAPVLAEGGYKGDRQERAADGIRYRIQRELWRSQFRYRSICCRASDRLDHEFHRASEK